MTNNMRMWMNGIFTRQERLALGFLLGIGLLGIGAQILVRPEAGRFIRQPAVSVNRAGRAELVALPGIGPVLADRILADRKLHGRFLALADLKRVKGMTRKTLEKLKGMVRFD